MRENMMDTAGQGFDWAGGRSNTIAMSNSMQLGRIAKFYGWSSSCGDFLSCKIGPNAVEFCTGVYLY